MVEIKSQRAKNLLDRPLAVKGELMTGMRRYPFDDVKVWGALEWDNNNVKNLSFFGELEPLEVIILETLNLLLKNKPISSIDQITFRECEAFLRDKNSEPAIEEMTEEHEMTFKKLARWLRSWPKAEAGVSYHFSSEKGPFRNLKLVEKIRELKAFLGSTEILTLYQNMAPPELIDVEDLTVFVQVPYETDEDKNQFHQLHLLGVEAFQEENLNFIPEA